MIGGLLDRAFDGDTVTTIGAGLLSGLAPLVARAVCLKRSLIRPDLLDLRSGTLVRLVLVFSVISALVHQIWFALRNVPGDFLTGFAVMQVGDMLGSLMLLYFAKLLMAAFLYDNRRS